MNLSRRQLFASAGATAGATAAAFTLGDPIFGRLNNIALATPITPPGTFAAQDWTTGAVMWDGGYSDMPYMIEMPSGVLLAALTVNGAGEGGDTQHVAILRSDDQSATWDTVASLEPPEAPESSWGMPWLAPSGRLYVFYTYNRDNIRAIPNNNGLTPAATRVDSIGVIGYRSTVDDGATWTERGELELPMSPIDLRNPFAGAKRLFWLSGHPVTRQGVVYLGVSKCGVVAGGSQYVDTEAFVLAVNETWPGTLTVDHLSAPIRSGGPVTEEPSPVIFDDDTIHVVFRTVAGNMGEAWSTDDGDSWMVGWSVNETGDTIPQPRAKAAHFRLPDGRFLLWGHNNNSVPTATFNGPRNPVFFRIGEAVGRRIMWGPPRLLIWDKDPATRISYPSLLVVGDRLIVAATDKQTARVFSYPLTF